MAVPVGEQLQERQKLIVRPKSLCTEVHRHRHEAASAGLCCGAGRRGSKYILVFQFHNDLSDFLAPGVGEAPFVPHLFKAALL